ncbi:MAG: hypothetical protein ACKN9D_01725 [Actinomycetales bacterium]
MLVPDIAGVQNPRGGVHRGVDAEQGEATAAEGVIDRRLFVVGVLAFLALQALSILVKKYGDFWNDYLVDALGEGLSVTSWVMLWFPVQIFTVEAWRRSIRRRRLRILEHVTVHAFDAHTYRATSDS